MAMEFVELMYIRVWHKLKIWPYLDNRRNHAFLQMLRNYTHWQCYKSFAFVLKEKLYLKAEVKASNLKVI